MSARYAGWFWAAFGAAIYLGCRVVFTDTTFAWYDLPVLLAIWWVARRMGAADLAMEQARDRGFDTRADGAAIRRARFGDDPPHGPYVQLSEDEQLDRDDRHFLAETHVQERERIAALRKQHPTMFPTDTSR